MSKQGIVIAGTNSGCGKTTITIGLMHLLKKKGYNVAPFKVGPDFIDPRFHEKVVGTPSYNLESYFMDDKTLKHLFNKHAAKADIAIAEGVMGMYDGLGLVGIGSTYETAKKIEAPIVLIVGCKGLYQSVSAIVKGFMTLRPDNNIKGVILNHVSSDMLFQKYKEFIETECGIKCIGYVPPLKDMELKSRHLGLVQAEEVEMLNEKVKQLSDILDKTIDTETLLNIATIKVKDSEAFEIPFKKDELKGLNLAVAYDKAFSFYYRDNLELLEELGAKLQYFSPLTDEKLPDNCNAIYFGGGYPEVFADQLSENSQLLQQIKTTADNNMPIFAECGGLMYLTKEIRNTDGTKNNMVGIFNCATEMTDRLKRFGYAECELNGKKTKCHEFHKSTLSEDAQNIQHQYKLSKPLSKIKWECGLQYKNVLAGYAHIHFWSNFDFTKQIFDLWKRAII